MLKTLAISFAVLISCSGAPPVRIGVSDPESGGMQVEDQIEKTSYFKPYAETGNWVCHPPEDYKALMEYFKRKFENCKSEKQ